MKFIQLKEGIFVRKSDIVAVEELEEGGSRVLTLNTAYDTPWMAESILQLLEIEDVEERVKSEAELKPMTVGLFQGQYFAG